MDILESVSKEEIKKEVPDFSSGDVIKVHFSFQEAEKTRTQIFQGIVLQKKGSGNNKTFTVRKISHGIAVERIFPLYSPQIKKIEIVRAGHTRRSKLFYLRKLKGRSTKVRQAKRESIKKAEKKEE